MPDSEWKVYGQLTDDIDEKIEHAKTLPNADILVPLYEAERDGKMTGQEVAVESSRQIAAKHRRRWRRTPM